MRILRFRLGVVMRLHSGALLRMWVAFFISARARMICDAPMVLEHLRAFAKLNPVSAAELRRIKRMRLALSQAVAMLWASVSLAPHETCDPKGSSSNGEDPSFSSAFQAGDLEAYFRFLGSIVFLVVAFLGELPQRFSYSFWFG